MHWSFWRLPRRTSGGHRNIRMSFSSHVTSYTQRLNTDLENPFFFVIIYSSFATYRPPTSRGSIDVIVVDSASSQLSLDILPSFLSLSITKSKLANMNLKVPPICTFLSPTGSIVLRLGDVALYLPVGAERVPLRIVLLHHTILVDPESVAILPLSHERRLVIRFLGVKLSVRSSYSGNVG